MSDTNYIYQTPFIKAQAYFRPFFNTGDGYVKLYSPYTASRTVTIRDFTFIYTSTCPYDDDIIWQWEIQREGYYPNSSNDFDTDSNGSMVIGTTNQEKKLGVGAFMHCTVQGDESRRLRIAPFQMDKDDHLVFKMMRFDTSPIPALVEAGRGILTMSIHF